MSPSTRTDLCIDRVAQVAPRSPRRHRSTGWISVGELAITRRIALVAVCCSNASVSWRLRVSSSLNSRTFSMAITAWSAKVLRSAICLSVKGRTSVRRIKMAPIATPSRSKGATNIVRRPTACVNFQPSGNSACASGLNMSSTCTTARSIIALPGGRPRMRGLGLSRSGIGIDPYEATSR